MKIKPVDIEQGCGTCFVGEREQSLQGDAIAQSGELDMTIARPCIDAVHGVAASATALALNPKSNLIISKKRNTRMRWCLQCAIMKVNLRIRMAPV